MILPVALTDRRPEQYYQDLHASIESALRHSTSDMLALYNEIKVLIEIENKEISFPEEYLTKEGKVYLKRLGAEYHARKFIQYIIEKKERYDLLMKNTDYSALIMSAYPQAKLVSKDRFWRESDEILKDPILVRGISSGTIIQHARSVGQDYYFIETGYLGNYRSENNATGRKVYHRIVKNEMQHSKVMDVPDDRWKSLVKFDPKLEYKGWKKTGSKILLVLPSAKPFNIFGDSRDAWIEMVMDTLKKHTDREIVVREKTRRGDRTDQNTIYDALEDDIYALVTYNSIAAVEAVQMGVPAFALYPTAAAPVCSSDLTKIETPYKPDEDKVYKWLNSIAYGQFSLEEMLTGQAWEMVLENAKRPTLDY